MLVISEQPEFSAQAAAGAAGSSRKLQLPTEDLRKAWAVSRRISKDDWLEWYVVQESLFIYLINSFSHILVIFKVVFEISSLIFVLNSVASLTVDLLKMDLQKLMKELYDLVIVLDTIQFEKFWVKYVAL